MEFSAQYIPGKIQNNDRYKEDIIEDTHDEPFSPAQVHPDDQARG
jgi:hypothetical protein